MSLASTNNRNDYLGNDTTLNYSYTFRIFSNTDLLVTVRSPAGVETTLVLNTDYTVAGAGDESGGSITLIDAGQDWISGSSFFDTGYTLTIRRVRPLTQDADIRNQGDFFAETHEDVFDKLVMVDQQQGDEISRSAKMPETVPVSDFDPTFPASLSGTPGVTIITNATGDGFDEGPAVGDISGAAASATAAAASATAAASSATAAATSETNAAASATAAASSATDAATAVNSAPYRDVVYITNADSPYAIDQTHNGKIIAIDASGGAVTVTLPEISTLTLPFNVGCIVETAGSLVTINRSSTDVINGVATAFLQLKDTGLHFIADTDQSPDEWIGYQVGTVSDDAITTAKLASLSVTRAKLATGAVAPLNSATKTANYTVVSTDDVLYADTTTGDITFTLPTASTVTGRVFYFYKTVDANDMIVNGKSYFAAGDCVILKSDGSNYVVLSEDIAPIEQTKFLSADWDSTDSNGVANDLDFSNLVTGQWYRLELYGVANGTVADNFSLLATHNASTLLSIAQSFQAAGAFSDGRFNSIDFQAGAATITWSVVSLAAGNSWDGNGATTRATLTRIRNKKVVSEF